MQASRTFFLKAFGCQMNVADAGLVETILGEKGFVRTADEDAADVILLLTCAVRGHAEQRALGRIGAAVGRKRSRPGMRVGVLGCLAQGMGKELVARGADFVVGPDQYRLLPRLLEPGPERAAPSVAVEFTHETYSDILPRTNGRVAALVPIMRGCDNFCSYCIVPLVRGRERSRRAASVREEVQTRAAHGVQEITLVGQNVLAYADGEVDFCRLLEITGQVEGFSRLRFVTAHPKDLSDRVILAIAHTPKVCPHLHLPLQSGSDRILALMNRRYTYRFYRDRIDALRRLVPGVAISTDLLVGFPGETEEDFKLTVKAVEDIGFDSAYMFRFSPRPGTRAAELAPPVPTEVAGRRLTELISLQNRTTRARLGTLVGKVVEVLVENAAVRGGFFGRTPHGQPVVIEGAAQTGERARVLVERLVGWTPIGRRLESKEVT